MRVFKRVFCSCNVTPRDRHDDFADQTDDVGIGATRQRCAAMSENINAAARFSGRHFVF
jgi:hypothetical protein